MQDQKKTFTKAEVEVIRFEKTDVIATSVTQSVGGAGDGFIEDEE